MTTKVLLAFPTPSVSSPQKSPPLSILHVGEALRQAKSRGKSGTDFEIRYWDGRYDDWPDMDWPDIVGCSTMTGYQIKGAIKILKDAKAHNKKTILGGIHATMQYAQCLSEPYVDSVVVGQGEWAILDAIDGGPKAEVHAVNLRTDEMVSPVSPDTLIHFKRSAITGDTMLMASRGCPYKCRFCYIVPFFHNKPGEIRWAKVDLDQWKSDILYLKKTVGITQLEHGDDWIGPSERLFEILEFLKKNGIKYRPSIRAHQITDEVARRMKELGVEHLSVGIETASPRMLELVDKGNGLPEITRCVEALAKYELWPLLYYITGFVTETQEEINETLDFADWAYKQFRGKVTQNFYAWVPLPGNALWDMVDKSDLPQTMEQWSNFSLNQTHNKQASNLYHVAGLTFHRGKGDKTDRNFPGLSRLTILPFEMLSEWRWKNRRFNNFETEKWFIEWLLKWASLRYENKIKKTSYKVSDMDVADWGVRENHPDVGAKGEYATGEIGKK